MATHLWTLVATNGRPDFWEVAAAFGVSTPRAEVPPHALLAANDPERGCEWSRHPSLAEQLSRALNTTATEFFCQTAADAYQMVTYENGECVRQLIYDPESEWVATGKPQPWERVYFFEGTDPLLAEELTGDDRHRYDMAKGEGDPTPILALFAPTSIVPLVRVFAALGIDAPHASEGRPRPSDLSAFPSTSPCVVPAPRCGPRSVLAPKVPPSPRYALAFLALAGAFGALAFTSWTTALPLAWTSANFLTVALAYLEPSSGGNLFGKRPNGTLPVSRSLFFAPYFALLHASAFLARLGSEPAVSDLPLPRGGTLRLARRLRAAEVPPHCRTVVDLTAEFARIELSCDGVMLPILDGCAPSLAMLRRALDSVPRDLDGVLVHCAQGHGRTALFTSCLLLDRGLAKSPHEAIAMVLAARPNAHMNPSQRAFLETWATSPTCR